MKLEKNFLKIIRNAAKEKTHAYDTTAEVTRVEGSTAWVHIDGGVAETPAELTISAKVGDKVKVRVSGGRAYLLGNSTAPPTDDRAANVAAVIASEAAFNVKQVQTEQGELRSEVTEECVKKGTSGILSLGSALVQSSSGLDIYSTVNGSTQATHTHIDGDSFDVVKDGVTVASFGATSTIGDSTRTVDPQDRDNFAQISASGFSVFEKSTYWGDYHSEIKHNAIKLFLDSIFSAMTDNRVFRNFFVNPEGMTFGDTAENTYFSVSTYPNDTTEPTMWDYQTGIRIGGTVLTENDLKKLKALIS